MIDQIESSQQQFPEVEFYYLNSMWRWIVVIGLRAVLVGSLYLPTSLCMAQAAHSDWAVYEGDAGASHYSALTKINRSNIKKLQIAWTYTIGDNNAAGMTPLVIDGTMYVVGRQGGVVALDAATGRELWIYPFKGATYQLDRGLLYWESKNRKDRRIFVARKNTLYAIDARNGQSVPSFGANGSVDLRQGIDRDPDKISATPSSPGIVFENLIILGSNTGEAYGSGPGDLRAFDARTGKLVWVFHTIPYPNEYGYDTWENPDAWKTAGGVNVWGGMSVDQKRGILYIPLGSATYDFYGADRLGANLFANSLVALEARTGKRLWHFQTVHHDLWDYDLAATPTLLTVRNKGKKVDIVVQAGKTGFLYVFNRVTGEPLWPIEERPVPDSEIPGEVAWPTQPFVSWPEPFAVQQFTPNDVNPHLPQSERDSLRNYVYSMSNKGLFTPPSSTPTMQMPGNSGGANWGSTAADPSTGTFYVLTKNIPTVLKLERQLAGVPHPDAPPIEQGQFIYAQNCRQCHLTNLQGLPPQIPSLLNVTERLASEEILSIVRDGRGIMPAFHDLDETENNALIAYLANPEQAPPLPQQSGGEGQPNAPTRYATGYGYFTGSIGWAIKPPWMTMTAYDMNSGNKKWQVPVGDVAALAELGITNTGAPSLRGGPTVTAGGLIFLATQTKFRVYDKDTGRELWTIDMPCRVEGIPAVYNVHRQQFVVIGARRGAGGFMAPSLPSDPPRMYIAFTLSKTRKPFFGLRK
ncbi:MAG: PQQ-binding-like beta-propeller repeat protein [Saprospiraceae bacterium]|nr:PQQ-binding-like beta-propeller repeat protein [Saprospiraceae bacterium]